VKPHQELDADGDRNPLARGDKPGGSDVYLPKGPGRYPAVVMFSDYTKELRTSGAPAGPNEGNMTCRLLFHCSHEVLNGWKPRPLVRFPAPSISSGRAEQGLFAPSVRKAVRQVSSDKYQASSGGGENRAATHITAC
jgi:hypothetical protein